MKRTLFLSLTAAALFLAAAPGNAAPLSSMEMATTLEEAFIEVSNSIGPTVVSIYTEQKKVAGKQYAVPRFGQDKAVPSPFHGPDDFLRRFYGQPPSQDAERRARGLGSGFVIREDGYILTNDHVVSEADTIRVTFSNGSEFEADVVGSDPRFDVAVIKIDANNLKAAPLGDSDGVRVGQWAIAIGNPYGHIVRNPQPTVTAGIVSALHRSLPLSRTSERVYTGLIQTDASINQGNSGGPLVDIQGRVVGMNTAILSPTGGSIGVGFAIPINFVKEIMSDLIEGKEVRYGWLGVAVQDIDHNLAEYFNLDDVRGALIASVEKGGPADEAGVLAGDVVESLEGEPIASMQNLLSKVGRAKVGSQVNLGLRRDGQSRSVKVTIGERPSRTSKFEGDSSEASQFVSWRGMDVMDIPEEISRRFSIAPNQGVMVQRVERGSPTHAARIRQGDLIISINHIVIQDTQAFTKLTEKIEGKALIRTQRGYAVLQQ